VNYVKNKNMKKEKKVRQYRSNQGRSPKQQNENEKMMFVSCMGLLITMLGMIIYGIFS
jgi:hypothetical protein